MSPFEDRNHEHNSAKYHTGKKCTEKGCDHPAGTWWSPYWCFEHNVERMQRITASLTDITEKAEFQAKIDKATAELRSWAGEMSRTMKAMVIASGGKLVIQNADKDAVIESESTHYGATTTTFHIRRRGRA